MDEQSGRVKIPAVFVVLFALYVLIRLLDNVNSWKEGVDPVPAATANASGEAYAALLASSDSDDLRIRALWKLVKSPDWRGPATAENPVPLAEEILRRAQSFYAAGNIPQSASHVQILLEWALRLGERPEVGANDHRFEIAELAIKAAAACPRTLLYPKLANEAADLSRLIEASASVQQVMTRTLDGPVSPMHRYLANRRVLAGLLAEYVRHGGTLRRFSIWLHVKCWALVCPLTPGMYNASVGEVQTRTERANVLRARIQAALQGAGTHDVLPVQP